MMRIFSFIILVFFIAIPIGMAANPAIIFGSGGYAENLATSGIKLKSGNTLDDESSTIMSTPGDIRLRTGENDEMLVQDTLYRVVSTGLESPNGLSINAGDSGLYDIAATSGQIVDPAVGSYVSIDYAGSTENSPATANGVTYVYLDNTGSIVTETSRPTPDDKREKLYLGRVVTVGGTVVQTLSEPVVAENVANSISDLARAIGLFNQEGNSITANGANLNIDKSVGKIFSYGSNYTTDRNNPHQVTTSSCTACTFAYFTQLAGSTGSSTDLIDPTQYDDAGTLTAVGGTVNSSTVQRIYLFPSGSIRVAYGQNVYSSLSNALEGVATGSFVQNPSVSGNGILIAYLVVKRTATDLSDSSEALFVFPNKFGDGASDAGLIGTSSLQDAYDNSIAGEIVLDGDRDGVKITDAASPILAPFFSVLSNDELTTYFSVAQDQVISGVDINMTGTGQLTIPDGTTAQRPTPSNYSIRGNTDLDCVEYYQSTEGDYRCLFTNKQYETGNFVDDYGFEEEELVFASTEGKQSELYIDYTANSRYQTKYNKKYYSLTSDVPGAATDIEFSLTIDRTNMDNKQGFVRFLAASADDFDFCVKIDASSTCQTGTEVGITATDVEFYKYEIPFVFGASSVTLSATVPNTAVSVQLFLDSIYIGTMPDGYIQSINDVDTDWIAYTPTTQGFGTITGSEFYYKRIGDSLRVRGVFTSGTSTAVEAQIGLPLSLSVRSDFTGAIYSGEWIRNLINNTIIEYPILSTGGDSFVNVGRRDSVRLPLDIENGDLVATSGQKINVDFEVPIEGWSTGRTSAVSQRTELCQVEANSNDGEAISANTEDIPFKTTTKDNCGAWSNGGNTGSNTNDQYTAQKDGLLLITGALRFSSAVTLTPEIYVNGVDTKSAGGVVVGTSRGGIAQIVKVSKDDLVTIRIDGGATLSNDVTQHHISITEIPSTVDALGKFKQDNLQDKYSETEITYGKWNGEQLYRRCFTVASDITTSSTITTWDSSLIPVNLIQFATTFWVLTPNFTGNGTSTNAAYITYDDATGAVQASVTGTYKIGAGASICMDYKKP